MKFDTESEGMYAVVIVCLKVLPSALSLVLEFTTMDIICLNWQASVASETLTGVTQSKIGDVYLFICIYVWTYVCHFVL